MTKNQYKQNRTKGLCGTCGLKLPLVNRTRCNECNQKHKEEDKKFREKVRAAGLCRWCKKNLVRVAVHKKFSLCEQCYMKQMERYHSLRKQAMKKLGGLQCVECGCDVYDALEINHINGNGYQERTYTPTTFFLNIINEKISLTTLNVLCRVCNASHYMRLKGIAGHKVLWNVVH